MTITQGVTPGTAAPSCHSPATGRQAGDGAPVVALAGAPNVGKSTLFNALTGAKREVGNWPGTSVEVGRGAWATADGSEEFDLIDLPGAYSLDALSPDEALTRDLLAAATPADRPDVVVLAADSARLARSLYLAVQALDLGLRLVVALTMADVAARRGIELEASRLSKALGTPVVVVDPRRRQGLEDLAAAVKKALAAPAPRPDTYMASCCGTGEDEFDRADRQFAQVAAIVDAATVRTTERLTWSDRIDRVALAPFWGPLSFLGVMWLVFQLTTSVAAPLQDLLNTFFTGPVSDWATGLLGLISLDGTWVRGFVVDGLIAGVGMLLTFAPLMTIMFALLAVLEDSGYMARAAVVTDRVMRTIGLPGRAFLPLIVGFGCNVPAIAATRVLPDARHRTLTALLVPFTSCSARLTVYVLIARTFFPAYAGTVVFAMYVISILFVVLVGLLLRRTLWRAMGDEPLILDLPPYQRPTLRLMSAVTWMRLRGFLKTASGIIVAAVTAVWLLQAIPMPGQGEFGKVSVEKSVYAATASVFAPVFTPAGFGNWQAASALTVGFVAKEAVISSWSQTYAAAEETDFGTPGQLGELVRRDFERTSGGHGEAAAWAFLVFLLAYTPCVATLAAQRREIGLSWTIFGVGLQLTVAWTVAVLVFQVVSRLV